MNSSSMVCLSQRPHGVPCLSLHVQMHAAGHHGEPGAFGQQRDAKVKPTRPPRESHQRAKTLGEGGGERGGVHLCFNGATYPT